MKMLKEIIGRGCESDHERRRYTIEWTAYSQVKNGDPYDETPYCHANERYAYREARERAEWQLKIHG